MRTVILGSGFNDGEIKLESKTKNNLYDKDKDLYTQCENDLKRLTRIMKTKFIGYHKREKKFYVSASETLNMYNNTATGKQEIYHLHEEFIDSVQKDGKNGEAYRELFNVTIPSYGGEWYDMTKVPGINFCGDLESFYTKEREAYAFHKKDFTHLVCVNNIIYGRIFIGYNQKNTLCYESKLSENFIEREGYKLTAGYAKDKPGKNISLRTSAVSDQDQSICSKNDPGMKYVQGKNNMCFQYGLLSCLAYLKIKSKETFYKKRLPNYLMDVEQAIKQNTVSLVGTDLIKKTNHLMGINHWHVHCYKEFSKKRKRDNMVLAFIDYNEGDQIIMVNLIDNDGITNHFVAICDAYIFDSNFIKALPLSVDNLSICCGSKTERKIFQGFGTTIVYRAPTNIKFA